MDYLDCDFLTILLQLRFTQLSSKASEKRNVNINEILYPNCDENIWLRTCNQPILKPLDGVITGCIPKWICGSLLRNGPGKLEIGEMSYQHLFDSSALVHRFAINAGSVTYQCRFIQSNTYKRNERAKRIVFAEFGTKGQCVSLFERLNAVFGWKDNLDNTMISIYPFGEEYYAFTESPVLHKINVETLDTEKRVVVSDFVGIVTHTSHPHIAKDGSVYNLGIAATLFGPEYQIICYPSGEKMFENAKIVATVPCRWKFYPSYMHSFGMSENFFLIIEQPLCISISKWIYGQIKLEPLASSLEWFGQSSTNFYLIERASGKLKKIYKSEAFFYLHVINFFETEDKVVVDVCCYRDPKVLNCMYIDSIKNMHKNADYAEWFRSRPLRFELPLPLPKGGEKLESSDGMTTDNEQSDYVIPKILCDLGCETPRINYESFSGRCYRYFYAISSEVDAYNPGALLKVDTHMMSSQSWSELNCYPSEPIFLPMPNAKEEDEGVVLSALLWGNGQEKKVALLILNAQTWKEIGRCEFMTPGPVPKCLHGWFAQSSLMNQSE